MPFAAPENVLAIGGESEFPPGLEGAVGIGDRQLEFGLDMEALHRVRPTVTLLPAHAASAEWIREAVRAGSRVIVCGRVPESHVVLDLFRAGASDFVPDEEGAQGVASAIDRLPARASPAPVSDFSVTTSGEFTVTTSGDFGIARPVGWGASTSGERRPASFPPAGERRPASVSPTASLPPGRPTTQPSPRPAS
ncbi:MAG: hypothetical protein FJ102_26895, partial [Deltaproteobacteria bacterium]|nr:hypothetical protein [Deltaproteobacteria bacterium]